MKFKYILMVFFAFSNINVHAENCDSSFYSLKGKVFVKILENLDKIEHLSHSDSTITLVFLDMKRYKYIFNSRYSDKPFFIYRDEVCNNYKDSVCIKIKNMVNSFKCDKTFFENYNAFRSGLICDKKVNHSCFEVISDPLGGWLRLEYIYFSRLEYNENEISSFPETVELFFPVSIYLDESPHRIGLWKATVEFSKSTNIEVQLVSSYRTSL